MKKRGSRVPALLLVFALLLAACGCRENRAATMYLVRTEGSVQVDDAKGKSVAIMENLGLFSGYGLTTGGESYGWICLDETKLAKMDEDSAVEVHKEDKLLELLVRSGNLYFNVTEPLEEDETMNIRTSSMLVGIRGTCGWVEVDGWNSMRICLLEGKVECTVLDEDGNVLCTQTIEAGQSAQMLLMGGNASITVEPFDKVPEFVAEAVAHPERWDASADSDREDAPAASLHSDDEPQIPWARAGLQDHVMDWQDDWLESAMREVTGITEGDIMLSDVWELTRLRLPWNGDGEGLTNISALGELVNLVELRLDSHQQLSDFSPLANLVNLKYLYANQTQLRDLGPFAGLVKLETLQIRYNTWIEDLSPLSGLADLETLELEGRHNVSDLTPLANLTNLRHLWISGGNCSDLSPLSGLVDLESLTLTNNKISDLSPLSGLKSLTSVGLDGNEITDLSPLSGLTQVTAVYAMNNQITDIGTLQGMESLTGLYLSQNQIVDVGPLANLTNLTSLNLEDNRIPDVSPLAGLKSLETLSLRRNPLPDVSPVLFVPDLSYDEYDPAEWEYLNPAEEPVADASPQANEAAALLAPYVGSYTPYSRYGSAAITLNADGTFNGGPVSGRTPSSIVQNDGGSIAIIFNSSERCTIYPAGAAMPEYLSSQCTASEVNIEYLYTGGGADIKVYHADPASLGG